MRLSNDSDHLADEDAESVAYPDIPNGSAAASGDSIHTERVVVSNHLVEVLRPNDDGHWVDENAGSKNSLEDAAIDGELILDCEDDDGDIQNGDDTDAEGNEEAYVQSLGAVDDAVMLTNSTTNAQDMDKPEHVESETMLALIREARSSRKFQSPSSVPLSVTDERLRDKLAQEAISVALRTRSRVTLQTLFGILRQHCVRIRGRSLMNSMTKLGYRFDRKLRCYVKS